MESPGRPRPTQSQVVLLASTVAAYAIGYPLALVGGYALGWALVFLGGVLLLAFGVVTVRRLHRTSSGS